MTGSEVVPVGEGGDFDDILDEAAEQVEAGVPVGIPTDTVYVLATDPTDPGATDRMFSLKQRPRNQDLSVLVASIEQALGITTALPKAAHLLMERFWPGPLTLVVPVDPEWPADLGDDELTVAVRMPDHPVPLALAAAVGPLAVTPAGVQGERVFETADEVAQRFGKWVPLVLDGGRCSGEAPTVVDATGDEARLIREGPIPWADVVAVVGWSGD
jgi:L-threonylcarbamoyladenylate synthase